MRYIKVTAQITPPAAEKCDVLMALMGDAGYESFVETEGGIEAFIPLSQFKSEMLDEIRLPFDQTKVMYSWTEIAEHNWNEEWEKNYFKPIIINNQCIVRSPFHEAQPDIPIEIIIEPKMSFGTGHHETTSMMIEGILEHDFSGKNVLDMGCGTGILAILASLRGAAEIMGIDIDDWCIRNSEENCLLNHTSNITLKLGDASILDKEGMFDIILANINKNILLADLRKYVKKLQPGGLIFLSGFYKSDIADINAEAEQVGLKLKSKKEKNNWTALSYELN